MLDRIIFNIHIFGEKEKIDRAVRKINVQRGLRSNIFSSLQIDSVFFEFCEEVNATSEKIADRATLSFYGAFDDFEYGEEWQMCPSESDTLFELHTFNSNEHWTNDINNICHKKPYFVVVMDDEGKEEEEYFNTEEEAVAYVKSKNSNVPESLGTLDEIDKYCDDNNYDILHCFYHTIVDCKCPKCIMSIIDCLRNELQKNK